MRANTEFCSVLSVTYVLNSNCHFNLNSNLNTSNIYRYLLFFSGSFLMENHSVSFRIGSQDQITVLIGKK